MEAGTSRDVPWQSKQDYYDWFFEFDCFFEVAPNLRYPRSIAAFEVTLLRDDALKWLRQAKTSGTAEEHDFDRFKAQLCSHFLRCTTFKYAKDVTGHKSYSKSLRTLKTPCGLLRYTTLYCLTSLTRNTTRSLEQNFPELHTPLAMPWRSTLSLKRRSPN